MPLSLLLSHHSPSLSGEKFYKREGVQWAILSGEGDPNFGERKNMRIIANEARDAYAVRHRRQVPRGFLIWLTCILILSIFSLNQVEKKRAGEIWIFILIYISRHFQSYGRPALVLTNFHPHYGNDSFHSWVLTEVWPGAREVRRGGSLRLFPAVHKHSLTEENIQWNLCENF